MSTWTYTPGLGYQPAEQPPQGSAPQFFEEPIGPQLREQLDELARFPAASFDVRCTDCASRPTCCRFQPPKPSRRFPFIRRNR